MIVAASYTTSSWILLNGAFTQEQMTGRLRKKRLKQPVVAEYSGLYSSGPYSPLSSASTFRCTVDPRGLALFAQLSWILPSLGQSTHQHHVGIVVVVCLQLSECVALVLPERDVRAYRTMCVYCVVCWLRVCIVLCVGCMFVLCCVLAACLYCVVCWLHVCIVLCVGCMFVLCCVLAVCVYCVVCWLHVCIVLCVLTKARSCVCCQVAVHLMCMYTHTYVHVNIEIELGACSLLMF